MYCFENPEAIDTMPLACRKLEPKWLRFIIPHLSYRMITIMSFCGTVPETVEQIIMYRVDIYFVIRSDLMDLFWRGLDSI